MKIIAQKYEVIQELGQGGTGTVYLVRHVDLGVQYALKVLCVGLSEDERFLQSFKQEAELLLRFTHPGTTQLRDFGKTDEGLYYIAMDYCDGTSLNKVIERDGPYSVRGALEVVIQILDVLEAAHKEGIVHRDIKPENIMNEEIETSVERIKILDFGTAIVRKQMDSDPESEVVGTPVYMSPEQAAGDTKLDARTDIYSVGVILYELLTGSVPFEGDTVVKTLLMHITQPPQPFAHKYGISEEIEGIVLRALEKQREKRFQSAAEFKESCEKALEHYRQRETVAHSPTVVEEVQEQLQEVAASADGETKILCLDDNEMILHILQHILEKEGYTVFTALDCSAIHDYLFQHKIDLLVSDVQMPGMPGTKVCRLLKQSMKELKVILFSNIPERDLEKQSKANYADGWVSKNNKPDQWLEEIQRVLALEEVTQAES